MRHPAGRVANRRSVLDHRRSVITQHNIIINRYNVINQCLKLVRHSGLGIVEKLKIETVLIRLKILLLDASPHLFSGSSSNDDAFQTLLDHVRELSRDGREGQLLYRLKGELAGLLTALAEESENYPSHGM